MKTLVKFTVSKYITSENEEDYQDKIDEIMLFLEENGLMSRITDENEISDDEILNDEDIDF